MSWRDRPGAPSPGAALCAAAELPELAGQGFSFGEGKERFEMFVVRWQGALYGYVNECPHAFTTLEWQPGRFFTLDKKRLLCSTHGAEFRIDDGFCLSGPCKDKRLLPIPVMETDGQVVISG